MGVGDSMGLFKNNLNAFWDATLTELSVGFWGKRNEVVTSPVINRSSNPTKANVLEK